MEVSLFWTEVSIGQLKDIFDYYSSVASPSVATKLVTGIISHAESLRTNQNIGQAEELLRKRKNKYRYLIFKSYKIVYWSGDNVIYISAVFDTRQNPGKLKKSVK